MSPASPSTSCVKYVKAINRSSYLTSTANVIAAAESNAARDAAVTNEAAATRTNGGGTHVATSSTSPGPGEPDSSSGIAYQCLPPPLRPFGVTFRDCENVVVRNSRAPLTVPFFRTGLPHQHTTLSNATAYYSPVVCSSAAGGGTTTSTVYSGPHSPTALAKYHENGHDTFSDFVTLVCQEAQSTQPPPPPPPQSHPGAARSPANKGGAGGTFFTSNMYPPPPPGPVARPVTIIRPSGKNPCH